MSSFISVQEHNRMMAELEAEIKALKEHADLWNYYRSRLLILATKYCPKDHHDWQEVLAIAEAAGGNGVHDTGDTMVMSDFGKWGTEKEDAHKWRTYTMELNRAQMAQRIAELEAKVEQYKEIAKWDWVQQQECTIRELKSDLDKAEEDAERYRAWKEAGLSYGNGYYGLEIYFYDPDGIRLLSADEVADKVIDAARGSDDA